jgi:hypothetical protein
MKNTHNSRSTCPCCGRSLELKPVGCVDPKHLEAWQKRRAYNRAYHKKWYAKNRTKKLAQNKAWDEANAETRAPYFREHALNWYHDNHQRAREREKNYYEQNKKKINSRRNRLMKERRKRDPVTSIRYNARSRLSTFLSSAMPDRQFSISDLILGYTNEELRAHLQALFLPGMTWDNYGKKPGCWEVDHIVPCSEFNFAKIEDIKECYALKNLRPLWAEMNRSGKYNKKRKDPKKPPSKESE